MSRHSVRTRGSSSKGWTSRRPTSSTASHRPLPSSRPIMSKQPVRRWGRLRRSTTISSSSSLGSPAPIARPASVRSAPRLPVPLSEQVVREYLGRQVLVTFGIPVPAGTVPGDFFDFLRHQGYLRVWLNGKAMRTDEPAEVDRLPAIVPVIQDRLTISIENRSALGGGH